MEEKAQKIVELEKKSAQDGFWDDPKKAGEVMRKLEEFKKETREVYELEKELADVADLADMAKGKKDKEEVEKEIEEIGKKIAGLERKTLFSEGYDKNDAILTIITGAGGVDAQDWSEMLLRMYLRWAEKDGLKARLVNETRGQEAGIKNATLEIIGPYAYGKLKGEAGVHRLVRLSPFNSDNLRQTSFAAVEVMPVIEKIKEVSINTQDLRIDVYRSQGAGGQSVNTTDSAVRITHLPTGIQASCQNERSQLQNKEQAMKILKAKLHKKHLEELEKKKKELKGETASAEWGNQIRSYVVHPYKMVKDHRTGYETAQAEKVLEGDIDEFIEAYLRQTEK